MIALTITSSPELSAWQQALTATEDQLQVAAVRTLNKTARWARTQVATQTAQALSINVGPIKKGLKLVPAKRSHPQSVVGLSAQSGGIKAKALGNATQNAKGVHVGKRQFDHTFLATMPSGHQGVFRRRGKTRLPIQEVQIVVTGKMKAVMEDLYEGPAMQRFEQLLERELRYLLKD